MGVSYLLCRAQGGIDIRSPCEPMKIGFFVYNNLVNIRDTNSVEFEVGVFRNSLLM